MGMNLYTYVGCYVVPPVMKQTIENQTYHCSNQSCKNNKSMNKSNHFCPLCGSAGEIIIRSEDIIEQINLYDFQYKYNLGDKFSLANDTDCWLPNQEYGGISATLSKHSSKMVFKMKDHAVENSKEIFRSYYHEYLKKFKEVYGIELEVNFGIVSSYA